MRGAEGVLTLVLLSWSIGSIAGAAWTQSWKVVTRGHFRITGWSALLLGVMGAVASMAATIGVPQAGAVRVLTVTFVAAAAISLVVQYSQNDDTAALVGYVAGGIGLLALIATGALLDQWSLVFAAPGLAAGAALWGATTNGMLLGHWYLNQPGLKPWALSRLTTFGLIAAAASALFGIVAAGRLVGAPTEGAAFGLPGFGDNLAPAFFGIWLALVAFTAAVIYAARRCVKIRSIQSATGLYYVAILTVGVSEFLVRYLMVNASA
ncbi:MAG: hypothetical protein M3277_10220 [Actinomycetota bacterium]|nr:hypothetical protein [Actinomycetota bacterium]